LIDNIKEHELKHILVYLKNQEKIDLMNKILEKIISDKNLKYTVTIVHSEQSKNIREDNLKKFRNANKTCILLSVGIFDEGVDEPCIDAVIFAEERNTQTRIVQNIGRCLRIDPNNKNKKKGYVLIPNIVYEFNDEDNDNEIDISKNYSSHFKMIRYIASVLHKNVKKHFYKKYVKGSVPDESDEEDNDINDQCDTYIPNDKIKVEKLSDIDIVNTHDLSKYFESECTSGNINNETLETIKCLVKKYNIDTLHGYGEFARKKSIPYTYLHNEFRTEWVSWGQFLHEVTYTYQEAKAFILKNYKDKFKESKEWVAYYETILNNELDNKRDHNIVDEMINEIIKIPNRPKEYYKGDWVGWDDFLGLDNDAQMQIGLLKTNADEKSKADKNIKVLMNNDHEKINKLIKGDFNDICLKNNLLDIKNYVDTSLGVDCILQPRVSLKKNGNYDKCCIQCRPRESDEYTIPIIIYPEENRIKYDHENLYIKKIDKNKKMNRTKDIFIQNQKIIKQFDSIINECKEFVHNKKKDEEIKEQESNEVHEKVPVKIHKNFDNNDDIDNLLDEFKKDNERTKKEDNKNKKDKNKISEIKKEGNKNKYLVKGIKKKDTRSEKKIIKDTYA
jgi:galactitol-specific phosphotransferase system IIB component